MVQVAANETSMCWNVGLFWGGSSQGYW